MDEAWKRGRKATEKITKDINNKDKWSGVP